MTQFGWFETEVTPGSYTALSTLSLRVYSKCQCIPRQCLDFKPSITLTQGSAAGGGRNLAWPSRAVQLNTCTM